MNTRDKEMIQALKKGVNNLLHPPIASSYISLRGAVTQLLNLHDRAEVPQTSRLASIKMQVGYIPCLQNRSNILFCKPQVRTQSKQTWVSTSEIVKSSHDGNCHPKTYLYCSEEPWGCWFILSKSWKGTLRVQIPILTLSKKVCLPLAKILLPKY